MSRLARADVFAPDEIAIVHVITPVVRRCGETITSPSLEVYGHSCEGADEFQAETTILMGLKPK